MPFWLLFGPCDFGHLVMIPKLIDNLIFFSNSDIYERDCPKIPMTWQNSQASMVTVEIRIKTFIGKKTKNGVVFLCVPYSEIWVHKRVQVAILYSFMHWPVLVYVLKFSRTGWRPILVYVLKVSLILMGHTLFSCLIFPIR